MSLGTTFTSSRQGVFAAKGLGDVLGDRRRDLYAPFGLTTVFRGSHTDSQKWIVKLGIALTLGKK